MKPLDAKIQQSQFVVLQSFVKLHVEKNAKKIDLSELPIDMEFDILYNREEEPYTVRLMMTIKGNTDKRVSGYMFELKVGGEYRLSEDLEIMGDEFKSLVQSSALACLINESRVYLQTLTAFFPFGEYIMPMIDMKDLWKQKIDSQAEEKETPKEKPKESAKTKKK